MSNLFSFQVDEDVLKRRRTKLLNPNPEHRSLKSGRGLRVQSNGEMPVVDKTIQSKFTTKEVNRGRSGSSWEKSELEGSGVVSITSRVSLVYEKRVGGGVRIHPENARMSGRHGVQYVAQCVACAALMPAVWQ